MKRLSFLIITIFAATVWGQTQIPENTSSPIYYKDGNVGVGTTSPSTKLHIRTDAPEDYNIKIGKFNKVDPLNRPGDQPSIYADGVIRIPQRVEIWGRGGGSHYLDIRDPEGNQKIKFDAHGNSFINGGNVGVGITSPSTKLHIRTDAPEGWNDIKIGKFNKVDPLNRPGDHPSIYADGVIRIPQRVEIWEAVEEVII